jgi:aspartyl-tRNA(Asn)/glutamyl-tRNA(Gln) amidotransferase subunit C
MTDPKQNTEHIDVKYVADLARLALTDQEAERYQEELEDVLGYMEKLNALNLDTIDPTAQTRVMTDVMRDDVAGTDGMIREDFLNNAPTIHDDLFVRVPAVIESEEDTDE